jgi:hypothetical protein
MPRAKRPDVSSNATTLAPIGATPEHIAEREALAHARGEVASVDEVLRWGEAQKLISRVETSAFFATVSDRVRAEAYAEIKKSKAYIGMPFIDQEGNLQRFQDLEEFCRAKLGKSYRRCEQILANYQMLGGDLYETAQRIGLGQRDYVSIKALPANDREVIEQAIAEGASRPEVIEKLVALTERQVREKEALQAEMAERDATIEAKDERAAEREQRIDKLQTDLRKAKRELAQAEPDQVEDQLRTTLAKASLNARAQIGASGEGVASVANAVRELLAHGEETGADHRDYVAGLLQELITEVRVISDEHALPILDQE